MALFLAAVLVFLHNLLPLLRPAPAAESAMHLLVLRDGALPRAAVSLLGGAALGLCGVLFQQVLRNPLAEPATLGVSGGAYLALAIAAIWFPALLDHARAGVALGGAALAVLTVLGLAWRRGLSPVSVILAGLVVGLYCGALAAGLALMNGAGFQSLFLWASGTLAQNGWGTSLHLAAELLGAAFLAALLVRPLGMLELGESQAASLGLPVRNAQMLALALATVLSAVVVAALGVIGFVSLAAPALARLNGARRFSTRLLLAPLIGGALLWLTDGVVLALAGGREFPTGAAVALLGAPLLLWMLPRLALTGLPPAAPPTTRRLAHPWRWALAGLLVLLLAIWVSLSMGRGLAGWEWRGWDAVQPLLVWRAPRMLVAMAAGIMLAIAGTLIQRLTGNPLASPEMLGVSSGSALGVILSLLVVPGFDARVQPVAAVLGSLAVLGVLLLLGLRDGNAPDRMLLGGVALATLLGGITAAFLASGDPRSLLIAQWLAGTTYLATPGLAAVAWGVLLPLGLAALVCGRWLLVLPLGDTVARGLGMRLGLARTVLLFVAAVLTAAATLVVGPLSFVGLLAPHAARLLGLARPLPQLAGAVLLAALMMVLADWLGRVLLFPAQLPAGLMATLLGTPYLLFQMRRR